MATEEKLIGDAGPKRYSAATIDALIAWVPAMIVGANLRDYGTLFAALSFMAVFLGYFLFAEGIWSTTVGKALMGLRVMTLKGGRPGFLQIFVRNLIRLIDANPVLLGAVPGAIVIFITPRRQRLGDLFSGTVVAVIPPDAITGESVPLSDPKTPAPIEPG